MTFYADFWVVSGTAAPVIALAAVVAYRDAMAPTLGDNKAIVEIAQHRFSLSRPFADLSPTAREWFAAMLSGGIALYNFLAQTATLTLALVSLADRANAAPVDAVIAIECVGLIALAAPVVFAAVAAGWRAGIAASNANLSPPAESAHPRLADPAMEQGPHDPLGGATP